MFPIAQVRDSDFDLFFAELLGALGFAANASLPAWWQGSPARLHVRRWRDDLGMSEDRTVDVATESRGDHPNPPDGPKAFDRFMERAAQRDAIAAAATANPKKSTRRRKVEASPPLAECGSDPTKAGREHLVGGPDTFTFREIGMLAADVIGRPDTLKIETIAVWSLRLAAALASAAGLIFRRRRRPAAKLHWMIWSGTHDAVAPACGARRLRDLYVTKTDAGLRLTNDVGGRFKSCDRNSHRCEGLAISRMSGVASAAKAVCSRETLLFMAMTAAREFPPLHDITASASAVTDPDQFCPIGFLIPCRYPINRSRASVLPCFAKCRPRCSELSQAFDREALRFHTAVQRKACAQRSVTVQSVRFFRKELSCRRRSASLLGAEDLEVFS